MRPAVAIGRPGTSVVPPGWAESQWVALAGTRTAKVSLRTARTQREPLPPYATDVPARIQSLVARGRATVEAATDTISVQGYLVALDQSFAPAVGDRIDITACPDADLVGRTMRISDILRASLTLQRHLICMLED